MIKKFSKSAMIRLGLLLACAAAILLVLPHTDHTSYSYEEGQPWKYPLLTAPFDMPIMRDSTSLRELRDSLDYSFVPFVRRDVQRAARSLEEFSAALKDSVTPAQMASLTAALQSVLKDGITTPDMYGFLQRSNQPVLRVADNSETDNSVSRVDASRMMSPIVAFRRIDSLYRASSPSVAPMTAAMARAINLALKPNVVIDTVNDTKFRNQEYLNIAGAQGIIKQGQRIVDRGEIITPQIYTNLRTYEQMISETKEDNRESTYFFLGQTIYTLIFLTILFLFLRLYRPRFFYDMRRLVFLLAYVTIFVIFAIVLFENFTYGLFLVPIAAVPVVILVFYDSRTAIFALLSTVMISAMVALQPLQYIVMELCAGLFAIFCLKELTRRSQLLISALITFAVYVVTYYVSELMAEGVISSFSWRMVGLFAINSVILSFAYVMIALVEKIFGFTSKVTLVELSDINNPLLTRLAEEAPGTFQHSMQVSSLAAEGARAIGANAQLVRVGALYHDIGKIESPIFFTENQHGANPHAGLDPATSANKIIRHVTDGMKMAKNAGLPELVRNFIVEHHGKAVTRYFYNTEANNHPGEDIDPTPFTYPGPNPRSRETTILMMADAVEAASRSLKDHSQKAVDSLVDKIIDSQIADGLYKDSPISYKDVQTIKNTFKQRLATIYHSRVEYPELKKKKEAKPAPAPAPIPAPIPEPQPQEPVAPSQTPSSTKPESASGEKPRRTVADTKLSSGRKLTGSDFSED